MQEFIYGITQFVVDIIRSFGDYFFHVLGNGTAQNANYQHYLNWFDSVILDGTLISSPLTWKELILYIVPLVLITLFIIFICKFIFKLIGMVKIW